MGVTELKVAAKVSVAYLFLAIAAVIAFGSYPNNFLCFSAAIIITLPWSVVAVVSSMLLIHVSTVGLFTSQAWVMAVGAIINSAALYCFVRWIERRSSQLR